MSGEEASSLFLFAVRRPAGAELKKRIADFGGILIQRYESPPSMPEPGRGVLMWLRRWCSTDPTSHLQPELKAFPVY
jgi:hypothetical protein